jgi:DNA topoisomerase VI subunit A
MDVDSLEFSYLDQAFLQIESLKEEIDKESDMDGKDDHRIFKANPFEPVRSFERQQLESQVQQSLVALGHSLSKRNSLWVVDRKNMKNYTYGKHGTIKLKSKDSIKFSSCAPRKCSLMLHVVAKIIELIEQDHYVTNRELYYHSLALCRSNPTEFNRVLDDLVCLLGCSKVHLRILCQPKGVIYGDIQFKLKNGEIFDCLASKEGVKIPTPQMPIVEMTSSAKFIIIIEKDSVLQKMLSQESSTRFVEKYKVILFTAKGYPDINSRAFVNLLWKNLRIPIFVLTDGDPHGAEIACCYKFGCYSTASEAAYFALPQIRWLGLLPSDVEKHPIPESSMISLTENDRKKLISLLKRPYLMKRPDWLYQLMLMRDMGKKAELESIDILGDYLTRTFIPNKLRYASWL